MFFPIRKQAKKHSPHRVLFIEPLEPKRMLAVITVNTEQDVVDPGDQLTSLREAIEITNNLEGPDEIVFDLGQGQPSSIRLELGELEVTDGVTIRGPGRDLLTIDAQGQSRIFNIAEMDQDVAIDGLTLIGGQVVGTDVSGGAIRSHSSGLLTLQNSAITNNVAAAYSDGSGISAAGDVMIHASTISGNTSYVYRSVIIASGNVSIGSSTIVENAGGIHADGGVTVHSSTISRNGDPNRPVERPQNNRDFWWVPRTISSNGDVTVSSSTIANNFASGIRAQGNVTITASTISGNQGGHEWLDTPRPVAGGVQSYGNVSVTSSTISANIGGGISTRGSVTVHSSTVAGNKQSDPFFEAGAGITSVGDLIVENSIVAGNQGGDLVLPVGYYDDFIRAICSLRGDCPEEHIPDWTVRHSLVGHNRGTPLVEAPIGHPDSNGNLIGGPVNGAIDPRLGPLADNGGPTFTHALLPDSPAINAADPLAVAGGDDVSQFDQRGAPFSRIAAGRIDIGSFESQIAPVDFNHDQLLGCDDVDTLMAAIVEGENPPEFDLTADQIVDQADLGVWLALAGLENLPSHQAYLPGDADLNGKIAASDLNVVGQNWLQEVTGWCGGDFNADGRVDARDLNLLALNWRSDISGEAAAATHPRAPLANAVVLPERHPRGLLRAFTESRRTFRTDGRTFIGEAYRTTQPDP